MSGPMRCSWPITWAASSIFSREAGKAELNIPMYVNAWLGPQPKAELPGQWPSGGPVARVMDIYRAAAPSFDLFAPDIYVPDFKGTCDLYTRSGNPLFIPEARDQAGNLFWALGHHAALAGLPLALMTSIRMDRFPRHTSFFRADAAPICRLAGSGQGERHSCS